MEGITIGKAAKLVCGTVYGMQEEDRQLRQIVIDSRVIEPGDLFAAYRGEHVDGHAYIQPALERGAACCLAEYIPDNVKGPLILVQDVQRAVETLAESYRLRFDIPVVGVTGSVGKTTAKEMIAAVLSRRFRTLRTEGNLNNQIGIPMMLSRLDSDHEAAVIEMGISDFGEMSLLSRMVRPTIAVYTVIGHAHLEFLHDLNGVLRAKTEMLEWLPETSPVIVNGDDEKLSSLHCRQRKITYGLGDHCDIHAEKILSEEMHTNCQIVCGQRRIQIQIPGFGNHVVYAALSAAAVGMLLGLSDEEIRDGIADFRNVSRRGDIIRTETLTLFDDSYNANPDSVRCAIDSLIQLPGQRHVCILGDMLEQGENSSSMHEEIGRYCLDKGIGLVLTSGLYSDALALGAGLVAQRFESRDDLIAALPELLQEGDCVLVKASKGAHFEYVSAAVKSL